jgi:hypothetical protein
MYVNPLYEQGTVGHRCNDFLIIALTCVRLEVLLADSNISGVRFETTLTDSHVRPGALPVESFICEPLPRNPCLNFHASNLELKLRSENNDMFSGWVEILFITRRRGQGSPSRCCNAYTAHYQRPSVIIGKANMFYPVGFEVFTAVVLKSIIFWDMTPCSP